jgi:hypothetical protein
MVEMMSDPHMVKIFLGMLGAVMALFAWASVISPDLPVTWKGGNRAPLSMPSRIAMAVAITSWCLILTGFHPTVWTVLFAACVAFGVGQSSRDRAAHDVARGITERQRPVYNPLYVWRALCAIDAFVLGACAYLFVRDLLRPPITGDQRFLHVMMIGYLVASALGAFYLYTKRPGKGSQENSQKPI